MRVNARLCTIWEDKPKGILQPRWCQIVEVSEEKDLGVTFDQQLSFGTNASKVVAAANSRLGLINRHFRYIETKPFMNF